MVRASLLGLMLGLGVTLHAKNFVSDDARWRLGDGSEAPDTASSVQVLREPWAGRTHSWPFTLTSAAFVRIEIKKVFGLDREHLAEPLVSLDNRSLGPLRHEHNAKGWAWVAPITLGPGAHRLEIDAGVGIADDFVVSGIRVYTIDPNSAPASNSPPQKTPVVKVGQAQSTDASSAPSPLTCAKTRVKSWPASARQRAILLSVMGKKLARTQMLGALKDGQAWEAELKPGSTGAIPLMLSLVPQPDGSGLLLISPDKAKLGKPNTPLGWRPGKWTRLRLERCQGALILDLGGEVKGELTLPTEEIWAFSLAAQEVELSVRPIK